jgi:hypothetical protein
MAVLKGADTVAGKKFYIALIFLLFIQHML